MSATVYTRDQPIATDDLSISQGYLKNNTNSADSIYGIDHYAFSYNGQTNQGFHNTVTNPAIASGTPPTSTNNCIFYAFQQSANIGLQQWSVPPGTTPVPTPITALQSPITGQTITNPTPLNVLNFTGLARAFCDLYVLAQFVGGTNPIRAAFANVLWDGSALHLINNVSETGGLSIQYSSSTLQIAASIGGSSFNNVYWTLKFQRLT